MEKKVTLESLYGVGDITDRMFVLLHKIEHAQLNNLSYEKEDIDLKLIEDYLVDKFGMDFVVAIESLFKANHDIWTLESDLRKGVDISNEEAGAKSKQIRKINDTERVVARNKVNEITKTGYTEKKVI